MSTEGRLLRQRDEAMAAVESLTIRTAVLEAAIDALGKAVNLPGGPALAMQQHDPTWAAWKFLCAALDD